MYLESSFIPDACEVTGAVIENGPVAPGPFLVRVGVLPTPWDRHLVRPTARRAQMRLLDMVG